MPFQSHNYKIGTAFLFITQKYLYMTRFSNIKFYLLAALLLSTLSAAAQQAKYVFYFIGDGMGVNQVNGTETYYAALEGRIGVQPLCFTQFPYAALVTTYSGTNGVTDSAAAGTALATSHKSKNGALGMKADATTPVNSIAYWAQQAGAAVGISTSVSVDHATPASFYAHQGARGSYYAISKDLIKANYDFYAGSDFMQPNNPDDKSQPTIYAQCESANYTIARGYKDYQRKASKAQRIILLQTQEASNHNRSCLPYAIDRTSKDMTLQQVTRAGINFLTKKHKDGFFLMVEGGKIDWACHSNDAGTMFRELKDMDEAVQVAYEFYEQHPDETLIVVTADHETGGLSLGRGPYQLHTDLYRYQRMSVDAYSEHIKKLSEKLGNKFTWAKAEADLKENWGFGDGVKITDKQKDRLQKAFEAMTDKKAEDKKTLYAKIDALADAARSVMAECALIGWQSGGHSNGYVPVFAVGVGAEQFHGQIDNTEIPLKITHAAGWTIK